MPEMRGDADQLRGAAGQARRRVEEAPGRAQQHQRQDGHADRAMQADDARRIAAREVFGEMRQQPSSAG